MEARAAMLEKILIDLAALATIAGFGLAVLKEWKAQSDDANENSDIDVLLYRGNGFEPS